MTRSIIPISALLVGIFIGAWLPTTEARTAQVTSAVSSPGERTAWYFYRVKWGYQDEFLELFRKNHYPVLEAQLGERITAFKAYVPTYHGDGRADWTFATKLTFRDAAALTGPSGEEEIARRLFSDFDTFRQEERRRFEILDAHWDVPLTEVPME
jgi:hypothetical protein